MHLYEINPWNIAIRAGIMITWEPEGAVSLTIPSPASRFKKPGFLKKPGFWRAKNFSCGYFYFGEDIVPETGFREISQRARNPVSRRNRVSKISHNTNGFLYMEKTIISVHETFQETIQGEGFWTGTPVDFIRLAGCPVGCHYCDTGYADGGRDLPRVKTSFNELIKELRSPRVVISGGEPFIHGQLPDLINRIEATGREISIETSGSFWQEISPKVWVTLSPKEHLSPQYPVLPKMWKRANEIKLVIETGLELEYYAKYLPPNLPSTHSIPVFLQPECYGGDRSLELVLELLKKFPQYRLSVQLHKYLGVK